MMNKVIILLILVGLYQVIQIKGDNPNLKYFGFYTYTDDDYKYMPYANLYEHPNLDVLIEANTRGLQGMWYVQYIFYTSSFGLRPDYLSSWQNAAEQVAPLIKNGTVLGFFMGDELINNGVSWDNLNLAVNMVRKSFPDSIIYTNEAFPTFTGNEYYPQVPENLDWVSIDFYPVWGTFQTLKDIYYNNIYPKMAPHQKVMFVPGVFSTVVNPSYYCGGNPHCEQVMISWNLQAFEWAKTDLQFVGLFPWHFDTFNTTFLPGFEIGLTQLPYLQQAISNIGNQITKGKVNPPASSFPSGLICGLSAGTGTADTPCNGVSAAQKCPSGYAQQIWNIGIDGDGLMSFCAIENQSTSALPEGGICGINNGATGDVVPCDGYDPRTACPQGYFQDSWKVDWAPDMMFFCSKVNSSLPDPTGSLCGMVTNGGSTGVFCDTHNPLQSCPTGYAPASWVVTFGDHTWASCFKI